MAVKPGGNRVGAGVSGCLCVRVRVRLCVCACACFRGAPKKKNLSFYFLLIFYSYCLSKPIKIQKLLHETVRLNLLP